MLLTLRFCAVSHHVHPGWHVMFIVEHGTEPKLVDPAPIYSVKPIQIRHFYSTGDFGAKAIADTNTFLAAAAVKDSIRNIVNVHRHVHPGWNIMVWTKYSTQCVF
jgi:hypothetical protein